MKSTKQRENTAIDIHITLWHSCDILAENSFPGMKGRLPMGAEFSYSCNSCGFSFVTSGPWEFYRDSQGTRRPYGHPGPASEEARQRGIYGLVGKFYCSECGKTYSVILVEFKKPFQGNKSIWPGKHEAGECEPKDEYQGENAVKCPKCAYTKMILEPHNDQKILCPKCKRDHLEGFMEWIA
jgi:hypothetical protein